MQQDHKLRQITENLFRLSPNTYELALSNLTTIFVTHKNEIIDFFYSLLTNNPGCFIQLTLILDTCESNADFFYEISTAINNWLITTNDHCKMFILIINLYFLSKYKFVSIESLEDFCKVNDLVYILELLSKSKVANEQIARSSTANDLCQNISINETILSKEIVINIMDHVELIKNSSVIDFNGDLIICYHIINTFLFDKTECGASLAIYFIDSKFIDMIQGIFTYYLLHPNKKHVLMALFLNLFKFENVLSVFFNMYDTLTCIVELKDFINTLMALIYERFFYPSSDSLSYYKTSTEYNPLYNLKEKQKYFDLLSNESLDILLKISNHDELKYQLRNEQKNIVPKLKIFRENECFDLKAIIRNKNLNEIGNYARGDFFKSFLVISRYSISHFLVHLSILQEYFVMDVEEQRVFCSILSKFFDEDTSFRRFVCMKLMEFNIIRKNIWPEFPALFNKV